MIPALYNELVTVKRRTSQLVASRDSLNNPIYGDPASYSNVYTNMPVRFAFSSKQMILVATGERITPAGVAYYSADYILEPMDRIITSTGIEYTVSDISKGLGITNAVDHYEATLVNPS